jgi:hypothetical protein
LPHFIAQITDEAELFLEEVSSFITTEEKLVEDRRVIIAGRCGGG